MKANAMDLDQGIKKEIRKKRLAIKKIYNRGRDRRMDGDKGNSNDIKEKGNGWQLKKLTIRE